MSVTDFAGYKSIKIPEGNVKKISANGITLWEAPKKDRLNLLGRTEYRGYRESATYYFNPANANHRMYLSEDVYVNGGRYLSGTNYYYSAAATTAAKWCTLSNITENSFTLTTQSATELFVAFPFHLNAGETIAITHTRSGHNRSGYQIFNTDGTLRTAVQENLSNSPGAVDTTTFTAPDECWFFWKCGRYDANTSVTISDIVVSIG